MQPDEHEHHRASIGASWFVAAGVFMFPMAIASLIAGRCVAGDWLIGRGPVAALAWGVIPAFYTVGSVLLALRAHGFKRWFAALSGLGCVVAFAAGVLAGPSHYPFG